MADEDPSLNEMSEDEIAAIVVDACYQIHTGLGPRLLESVYEAVLDDELRRRGLRVQRQVAVPITWGGVVFEEGFRADLIVEGKVIIELKSVEKFAPVHWKQLMTYLKLMNLRLGLLVNFGDVLLKDGIRRIVNNLMDDGVARKERPAKPKMESSQARIPGGPENGEEAP